MDVVKDYGIEQKEVAPVHENAAAHENGIILVKHSTVSLDSKCEDLMKCEDVSTETVDEPGDETEDAGSETGRPVDIVGSGVDEIDCDRVVIDDKQIVDNGNTPSTTPFPKPISRNEHKRQQIDERPVTYNAGEIPKRDGQYFVSRFNFVYGDNDTIMGGIGIMVNYLNLFTPDPGLVLYDFDASFFDPGGFKGSASEDVKLMLKEHESLLSQLRANSPTPEEEYFRGKQVRHCYGYLYISFQILF